MDRGRALGLWRWVALLLFGYVLARPVSTNAVLVPVLAAIGAVAAGTIFFARRRLHRAFWPAVLATLAFAFVGLLAGPSNPGFLGGFLVFVAAPVLWWMAATAMDERILKGAFTTLAVVTVFVGGTVSLYALGNTGLLPQLLPTWLLEQQGAGFGGVSDYTEVRLYGLSTLVATGPLWVGSLFVGRDAVLPPYWLRSVAAVAATAGTLSGGRRALALVLVLAPLLAWGLSFVLQRSHDRTAVHGRVLVLGIAGLAAVGSMPGLLSGGVIGAAWQSLAGYVTGGVFPGQNAADDRLRTYQADRLLDEWAEEPVFGHGFGATIDGFARDYVEPWRWELQYHGLLFQTGVVGLVLIVLGALVTLNGVVRAARHRPDLTPTLVVACTAAVAMLIGNATNPYLQAPGHVWSILLPVAVANVMLLSPGRLDRAGRGGAPAIGAAGPVDGDPVPAGSAPAPGPAAAPER